MTWNKDRKQTKYGHKRQEQMTHITEPWHNSPLLKGLSRALTVPSGRALWRPLRTNTDKNTGRGPPEWNRQTGTMAELGALEAMAVQGAQEAMVELGALEAMAELGALEAMAVQGAQEAMVELGALEAMAELGALEAMAVARELWRPWQMVFGGLGLGPAPTAGTPSTPPQNFPGEVRGYQEPSWARHTEQYMTWQDSRARQTGQDIPKEPLPPPRQGGRRLEWPPWPQQEEPPAPDESPWTRHDKVWLKCSCGHNTT